MQPDPLTYLAYGSNRATARLQARTPLGWRLNWHTLAQDGSGQCRISHTGMPSDRVYGVLYHIDPSEQQALDRAEGLGFAYRLDTIRVAIDEMAAVGSEAAEPGPMVNAMVYMALSLNETAVPYRWYKQFVVAGAIAHGLPAHYVAQLQSIVSQDDLDTERQHIHSAILDRVAAV